MQSVWDAILISNDKRVGDRCRQQPGRVILLKIFSRYYRGFEFLDLNIDDVTFLVGDNSSGKSSIIHLISYIYRTELNGTPQFDENFSIKKYDFFSPYFANRDVTIGFISEDDDGNVCKIITLHKKAKVDVPEVVRMTVVADGMRLTLACRGNGVYLKYNSCDQIADVETALHVHEEATGFSKTASDRLRVSINEPIDALEILGEAGRRNDLAKLIFRSMGMNLLPGARHIGPLRGLPEGYYEFSRRYKASGAHFASMWHELKEAPIKNGLESIRRFGRNSGLFDEISVERISKKIEDSPLIVSVSKNERKFYINQVGIGVSQVVPILVESVFSRIIDNKNSIILLEQPELHLHPVAQAAMGEFIYDTAVDGLAFLVETHSDFLIDRFRARVKESGENQVKRGSIWFFRNTEAGNHCAVIKVQPDGRLLDAPDDYKDFFVNELMRTMF